MRLRAQALATVRMQYEGVMHDACRILVFSGARDAYGAVLGTYTAGAEVSCLYSPMTASESHSGDATPSVVTGKLRVPLGTVIDRRDRVRITKRFGVALDVMPEYAIEGPPRETAGFIACELSEVTP